MITRFQKFVKILGLAGATTLEELATERKYDLVNMISDLPMESWTMDLNRGVQEPLFEAVTPKRLIIKVYRRIIDGIYLEVVDTEVNKEVFEGGIFSLTCPIAALYKRLCHHPPFRKAMDDMKSFKKLATLEPKKVSYSRIQNLIDNF